MNKKLLMAAVASALVAAPVMSAHAAATVYGKLNVGVASVDNGNTTDSSTLAVTDNASRFGVKGDEDLGGGLKAIYTYEVTIDGDNGGFGTHTHTYDPTGTSTSATSGSTAAASGRDVFAGLQGGWGSVRLGSFNSVYKSLSTGLEVFGDTTGDFTTYGLNGESREANQISYSSPNMSGFQIGIASSRGETGLSTESNPMMIAATYTAGPLYLGIGTKDMDLASSSTTGLDDSNKLVGRFNMDAFSVWAVLETQSVKGTKSSANSETDTTHIGASYKMGNNTFALTYTDADNSEADYDATSLALGVIHALSKNTAIKGVYTTVDNDRLASRSGSILSSTSMTGAQATAADKDPSAFEVQLSVSF